MTNKTSRQTKSSPPQKISELETQVGFWLRFVSNQVSERFRKSLEESGVTLSEWGALRTLYTIGEAGSTELIETLGMTKGAVSKIVARLEEKKLVAATSVKEDRRARRIALTAAGRKLVPRLAAIADENDRAFFGHLTRKAQEDLIRLMKDLVLIHNLGGVPVE